MNDHFIFVYGLLKSMYDNDPDRKVRAHCSLVSTGFFPGTLIDLGTYPGAIYESTSHTKVHGELYKVERNRDELTKFLDHFEGVGPEFEIPNEYNRVVIPIETENGQIQASTYVYNWPVDGKTIIENGFYKNETGTRG